MTAKTRAGASRRLPVRRRIWAADGEPRTEVLDADGQWRPCPSLAAARRLAAERGLAGIEVSFI